jgi:ADP-heptose:LPS heptosyltransferase
MTAGATSGGHSEFPPAPSAQANNEEQAARHTSIANILDRRGDVEASLAHLRRAHELTPGAPQAGLNLAMALLRLGRYREGFRLYEARLDKTGWSGFATLDSRAASRHLLLRPGDRIDGKRILLLAEQGLGDAIMCARYIPLLAERGARVIVASSPTLRPFFARVDGIETLLSPPADQPFAQINLAALPFDTWLPILSLPHWFGTEQNSIPRRSSYWAADAARVAHWRNLYVASGDPGAPTIGLVFQANPGGAAFATKSLRLAELSPLFAVPGVLFVNLQYGPAGRELAHAVPGAIDVVSSEVPLDDYAAALAATDVLITVDTMAAHLAGALGHPAWVAVPYSPHWVWGLRDAETPWYAALRLFRQHKEGDWSGAVAAIARELQSFVAARGGKPAAIAASDLPPASDAPARLDLALQQLRRGEVEQGFAHYEARREVPLWSAQALPLRESLHAVDAKRLRPGDPVASRRIAVFTEQGLGDIFLGARFVAALADRGAAITMICRAPMRPFFARLSFVDTILSPPEDAPHAKIDLRRLGFDAFCPLLSLPYALGLTREPPRANGAYLAADPVQVTAWRERYRRLGRPGRRKIGVVWRANPANEALAHRSMRAGDLAPLAALDGIDLVNLQRGGGPDLARVAPQAIDAMQAPLSLDEFAAALAATDAIVSVDTMAAHCAGALGHRVCVLLPREAGWWWGEAGATSVWYPSAHLFRRSAGTDWRETVRAVADALVPGTERS